MTPEQKEALRHRVQHYIECSNDNGLSLVSQDFLIKVLDALARFDEISAPQPPEWDAAITAFLDAVRDTKVGATLEALLLKMGAGLDTAKPAPAADTGQAVAVKPLEWVQDGKNFWKAAVTWGEYYIAYNQSSRMGQWLWNIGVMDEWLPVDTFDIAKAQAQADYERRILSALAHLAPLDAEGAREAGQ